MGTLPSDQRPALRSLVLRAMIASLLARRSSRFRRCRFVKAAKLAAWAGGSLAGDIHQRHQEADGALLWTRRRIWF